MILDFLYKVNKEMIRFRSTSKSCIYDSISRVENIIPVLDTKTRLAKDFLSLREFWNNNEFKRMFNNL